jgi:hypothetical protein
VKRVLLIASLFLCIGPALVRADDGEDRGSESRFRRVTAYGWGGQPLVAPRSVFCSVVPTVKLQKAAPAKARVLYGSVPVGDKKAGAKLNLAVVRAPGKAARVYLDANHDGVVTEQEGQDLKPNAVAWGPCRGKPAALARINFATKDRVRITGPAVVWSGNAPHLLFFAWQGFLHGTLNVAGQRRESFLVDANANGSFFDAEFDQFWIDLNGDGRLDILTEEFAVGPVQRWCERIFSLSFSPAANTVRLRPIEGGLGKTKVVLDSREGTAVKTFAATLISQAGDVASVNVVGQEIAIPTGRYHISSLTLAMTDKSTGAWSYSFSNWADSTDDKEYPLMVEKGVAGKVAPFRNLTFDAKVEGERKPGGTLRVELSARSEMNLELTKTEKDGASRYGTEDYARIELLNPDGKTVATASTGFS